MTPQTWQLDTAHTTIGFTVRHMVVAKVHGRFTKFDGKLSLPDGDLGRGTVEVNIDANSIDTQVEARDNHLRSPDFFESGKFPHLTFRSTAVEKTGKDRYRVKGQLTIRDVTREVELDTEYLGKVTDPFGAEKVVFSATTQIDRKAYGLTWNKAMETGGVLVADRIDIQLDVQAVRAAEQASSQAA